jgi:hypothetical protein
MAPLGKERTSSLTPNTITVGTSGTASQAINLSKVPIPEMFKSEPFYGFRQKFKAFYTQVRLYAWADLKRPAEKRIMRYSNEQVL